MYSGLFHEIAIEKLSIETKLPEPYNPCKKSSVYEPYHQMNCIEACTYKEIKNKYICTFHSTLFSIQGIRQCPLHYLGLNNYNRLKSEFSESCLKQCPLESLFFIPQAYTLDTTWRVFVLHFASWVLWTKLRYPKQIRSLF